jgi:hypothetical protein
MDRRRGAKGAMMTQMRRSCGRVVLLLLALAAPTAVRGDDAAAEKARIEAAIQEAFNKARAARQAPIADTPPAAEAPEADAKSDPKPGAAGPPPPGKPDAPAETAKPAPPPIDPLLVRCQMADGTVIVGKLSASAIEVDTKFGRLSVPILQLVSIRPGLDSRPQQRRQIQEWLTQLAGDDANQRKAAATELAKIGPALRPILEAAARNAAGHLKTELPLLWNRIADELGEDLHDPTATTTLDVVRTGQFDMTGRVVQQTFTLATDFGTFTLPLASLVRMEREAVRNTDQRAEIAVTGEFFAPRGFLDSQLHIEKGDKVTIKATGFINFNRYGSNIRLVPDGAANYGWYITNKIANGALCYRIGGDEVLKAGTSVTFIAKKAGKLEFAVAMHERYLRNEQPATGEYKVQVKIERK